MTGSCDNPIGEHNIPCGKPVDDPTEIQIGAVSGTRMFCPDCVALITSWLLALYRPLAAGDEVEVLVRGY